MRSRFVPPFAPPLLAPLLLAGCGSATPTEPAAAKRSAAAERREAAAVRRLCGSQGSFDRLKAAAFDDAARVRGGASPALRRLADLTVARMEQPVAVRHDAAVGLTVCRGRLILELPPGTRDALDGEPRLRADVEYAVQEAADGSGPVFRMTGAEPIVYRLAAMDLAAGPAASPSPAEAAPVEEVAEADLLPPPPPLPPVERAPRPAPEPTVVATAAPPAPRPAPTTRPAPPPRPAPTRTAARAPRPAPTRAAPPARPVPERVARAPAPPPTRPSFPCGYARTRVERLVCADPRLARADRAMGAEYRAAVREADPDARRELERSRGRFLAFRDRCPDAGCVAQAYADRIDEIRDIAGGE